MYPRLKEFPYFSIDTETHGLMWWLHGIFGVSISTPDGNDYYWDIRDDPNIIKFLKDEISSYRGTIIAHNLKFDWHMLRQAGIPMAANYSCTMIRAALIDEHLLSYDLDSLGKRYVGVGKDTDIYEELASIFGGKPTKNVQILNLPRAPSRIVGKYAKQDTRTTLKLWEWQNKEIEKQNLERIYKLEMDLLPVIIDMEYNGVKVDIEKAEEAVYTLKNQIDEEQYRLDNLAGFHINPNPSNSIKDLFKPKKEGDNWVLVDGTIAGTTPAGNVSIDADTLRSMKHPAAGMILHLRKLIKTRDTFLLGHILSNHNNGVIHANYNQTKSDNDKGTGTGRLSVNSPALQQIHKRDKNIAPVVRGLFIPDEGCDWVCNDWCVSGDTEFLTENGWVRIDQYAGQKIAVPNLDDHDPKGSIVEYEKPLRYITNNNTSNWYEMKGLLLTGNHRQPLYRRFPGGNYVGHVREINWLHNKKDGTFTLPQVWSEEREGIKCCDDMLRLGVAIQADGSIKDNASLCEMVFSKNKKVDRLIYLLDSLKIKYSISRYNNGNTRISFTSPILFKSFGDSFWWNASIHQRKIILEECLLWDGTVSKDNRGGIYKKYHNNDKLSIDFIQWCAHSTGLRAEITNRNYVNENHNILYTVNLGMKTMSSVCSDNVKKINLVDKSYCFTTSTGYWVARRNGKIIITGNCQMDFRVFAHYVNDPQILDIYRKNPDTDFHQLTSNLTGLPRSPRHAGDPNAKQINLGLIFGMGQGKLAWEMGLPYTIEKGINGKEWMKPGVEAIEVFNKYHNAIPGVQDLLRNAGSIAKSRGYVITIMGRHIRFPGGQFTYKAGGLIFQGSAADALKVKLVEVYHYLKSTDSGSRLLLNVHDEFDTSVPNDRGDIRNELSRIVTNFDGINTPIKFRIPIRTEQGIGPNWWEASK